MSGSQRGGGMIGVGIIGTGNMGTDHARRVHGRIDGARLVALCDTDPDRLAPLAHELGASAEPDAGRLIESGDVDAVIVASASETHPDLVLACIAAAKPVLCEKPLALTAEGCLPVLEAEVASGRHLVSLGYMRRFDPGYLAIRTALLDGSIGVPVAIHCIHRNRTVPPGFTAARTLSESVVHEIDVIRWLLGDEIVAVSVLPGRPGPSAIAGLHDPLVVILETATGVVVDIEAHVTAGYGYDVRCEVSGSAGYATLGATAATLVNAATAPSHGVPEDWLGRFGAAYDGEVQAWVHASTAGARDMASTAGMRDTASTAAPSRHPTLGTSTGASVGASAWDGYVCAIVAAAAVQALEEGARVRIALPARPAFYDLGTD